MNSSVTVISEEQLRDVIREVVRDEMSKAFDDLVDRVPGAPAPDNLLTREEVAALLRIDVRTVRRMVLEGDLPEPIRIGARVVRWRMRDLERALGSLRGEKA